VDGWMEEVGSMQSQRLMSGDGNEKTGSKIRGWVQNQRVWRTDGAGTQTNLRGDLDVAELVEVEVSLLLDLRRAERFHIRAAGGREWEHGS